MSSPTAWDQRDWDYFASYVNTLRELMHLDHYALRILDEPCDEGSVAEVKCIYKRRVAHLRFAHDFRDHTPEEQRSAVVHEMIHIIETDRDTLVLHDLPDELGLIAKPFERIYERLMELSVDHLCSLLEGHLPLPEWPSDEAPVEATA